MSEPETTTGAEDGETAVKAAKAAKADKIARYVVMFLFPLLLAAPMTWGYLYGMHSPTPHNMPVSVVAASDSAADQRAGEAFASALEDIDDDPVKVESADSTEDAMRGVTDRDTTGAVVVGADGVTLHTAGAAGMTQSQTVREIVGTVAAAQSLEVTDEDLAVLPDSDPAGLGAMFMTTAILTAGYMPLSIALSNSPQLLLLKRRAIPILAGWAAVVGGLVWFVSGPCLHVVPPENAWAVFGITWLGAFAVSTVQMFLTRIFGPLAVILGLFLVVSLGVPSSGLSVSYYAVPGFFQFLHGFLPAPALGESLRAVMYFGGTGVWPHLLVLIIGAAVGWGATALLDLARDRKGVRPTTALVNMPSLHGGPRPKSRFWQYVSLAFFPFLIVVVMISAMLGAMHDPSPRNMPVVVSGATTEQAEKAAGELDEAMPGMFDVSVVGSAAEARQQVKDREAVGAYLLPSGADSGATVVVNQAGGSSSSQIVDRVFTQVAEEQGVQVSTENVAPLPDRDSIGTVSLYIAIGWMMAGFMVIVIGANAQPRSRPLRRLLPILAGYSVLMSAVIWLIAGPIVGAVSGHGPELIGVGIVAILCVAMFATLLERLFGLMGLIPVLAVIMFLGVPASGGALSVFMEPTLFVRLHEVLPMASAVEAVRSVLYFGSDIVWSCLGGLAVWGVVSLLVVMVVDRFKPVQTELEEYTEHLYNNPRENTSVKKEPEGSVTSG